MRIQRQYRENELGRQIGMSIIKIIVLAIVMLAAVGRADSAELSAEVDDSNWRPGPSPDWFVNWDKALADARARDTALFILNNGSDWCGTCKAFKTNVLDKAEFIEFARENLTLLYIDIPIRNPLSEEQKLHNWLVEKYVPFGQGVPSVVLMNTKGEKLGSAWHGRKSVGEYIDLLRTIVAAKGESAKSAERLFKNGYACLAAETIAERSKLPPVSQADFRAIITGVAVLKRGDEAKLKDVVFHPLEDPLTIPSGSEAVFRLEYEYPKGYGGIAWVEPHRTTHWEFHNEYFRTSRISDEWCHGTGTTHAAISLTDKGKSCTLCEVSIRINSDPRQGDLQFGWVAERVSVNVNFTAESDEQTANRPTVSKYVPNGLLNGRAGVKPAYVGQRGGASAKEPGTPLATSSPVQTVPKDNRVSVAQLERQFPFDEAVRLASKGNGSGLYSLAFHYAAGLEIAQDGKRAAKYLEKAIEAKNGNAALVKALVLEDNLKEGENRPGGILLNRLMSGTEGETPHSRIRKYTGYGFFVFTFKLPSEHREGLREGLYVTNDTAVAIVRSAYKKAVDLGCPFAKEEKERFERHVKRMREQIRAEEAEKQAWIDKVNANARLAQELLGEPPEMNPVYDKIRHTAKRDRVSPADAK